MLLVRNLDLQDCQNRMHVAKITDHFEEFDSYAAKLTVKLLVGFS